MKIAISLWFAMMAALVGCGDPCGDLKKLDCSTTKDAKDCEDWKKTVLGMNDSSACKDNLENNSAFKKK